MTLHKLTFEEAKKTSLVFYNDEKLEEWFENLIQEKAQIVIEKEKIKKRANKEEVVKLLSTQENGLRMMLNNILFSQEKFLRLITLLRRIEGSFDGEWKMERIKKEIKENKDFAEKVADLLINGKEDPLLAKYLPKIYLERLSLKSIKERHIGKDEVMFRLKDDYIGDYTNEKGKKIEGLIKGMLDKFGVSYEQGRTDLVDVTVDIAIPDLQSPRVIIMATYNETTSSGQSTKTRDMNNCYKAIQERNREDGRNRIFINFADGGGWLVRESDMKKLVENCHYFLNISNLHMLDKIIQDHCPDLIGKKTK